MNRPLTMLAAVVLVAATWAGSASGAKGPDDAPQAA